MNRFMHRLSWQLAWRLAAAGLLLAALAWAARPPVLPATLLVLLAVLLMCGANLWRLLQQTNQQLARLALALQHDDFSQTFEPPARDAAYGELAAAFQALLAKAGHGQQRQQAALAEQQSLIEQVPTPLLLVDASLAGQATVQCLNPAARSLFAQLGPARRLDSLARLEEFGAYGPALLQALRDPQGEQAIDLHPTGEATLRVRLSRSELRQGGRVLQLIALQPVQQDIDSARSQLASDLVRVLTHEVMNSLTPVTSLAASAAQQAAALPAEAGHADLQAATAAVARRAQGLMAFVERHRELARAPQIRLTAVSAQALSRELASLFRAEWPQIQLVCEVEPGKLHFQADAQALTPVLLNLLRNAAQAAQQAHTGTSVPAQVRLGIACTPSGRTRIDIDDNGAGIPPEQREEVFLPFFTTKPEGSGIGLSLARQVVLAHGGSVQVDDAPLGGARLRIVL